MSTSDKCPRCDCQGNEVACGICFYYNFRCPGNCKCCAGQRETSTQRQARLTKSSGNDHTESTKKSQARTTSDDNQTDSTQKQVEVTYCMDQKKAYSKREKRAPVRPLILRDVKKSLADSQKKARNSVFDSKAEESTVNEPSTKKEESTVKEPSTKKVKTETQITPPQYEIPQYEAPENEAPQNEAPQNEAPQHEAPQHKVTLLVENEIQQLPFLKEFLIKEDQELERQWNRIFWPQWDTLPCEPHNSSQTEREDLNIIKEKLQEKNKQLIGDYCLNCPCEHPRDYCDICRLSDYQCLGTCLCCNSFRLGQRVMVFVTRGIRQLSDGSFFGGGNVSM